ncbi:MAG: CopG family transcriptional regulator [Desulfuromonadales bacterium]|nr:CopG family transcriptional regulator [Desulfuromonadales bacterium]
MSSKADCFRDETIARWEEFCLTGKSVPHDVVMAWFDSWGTGSELEAPIYFSA